MDLYQLFTKGKLYPEHWSILIGNLSLRLIIRGVSYAVDLPTEISRATDGSGAVRREMRCVRSGEQKLVYEVTENGSLFIIKTTADMTLLRCTEYAQRARKTKVRTVMMLGTVPRYVEYGGQDHGGIGVCLLLNGTWTNEAWAPRASEFLAFANRQVDEMRHPQDIKGAVDTALPQPIAEEIWAQYSYY